MPPYGKRVFLTLLLYGCCCACFTAKRESHLQRIAVDGQWFVDSSGRTRLFHGMNAVIKQPPWYPVYLLNETRLKYYREWGFNVIRLGTMWAGTQPQENSFNETYISITKEIVQKLEQYGMYSLLDMHQDVISSRYGSYDGIPRWLADKFPPSPNPYPWPLENITAWSEGYLTQAVGKAFQALYTNIVGATDCFVNFWLKIASVFKDYTSVLGYELINEPWPGDVYSDPSLFLPSEAGKKNLMPTYNQINKAIRQVDNHTIVFFEPTTWGVVFWDSIMGTGFSSVPGGPAYRKVSALSYHYYCWLLQAGEGSYPYPPLDKIACDELLGPKVFSTVAKDVQTIGCASFLTEFGICGSDGNPNSTNTIECDFVMGLADQYLQSWTYWDANFFNQDGNVNWKKVKPFARTYARAVAGTPSYMSMDLETGNFTLRYTLDPTIQAPTEVFIPPLHYPHGITVVASVGLSWSFDEDSNVLSVTHKEARINKAMPVQVSIFPKDNVW